jgi:hypothetical protein
VDRLARLRRGARRAGTRPGAAAGTPAAGRRAGHLGALLGEHALHQHDPAGRAASIPGVAGDRAADQEHHPLERHGHGRPGQPARARDRGAHLHVRLRGDPLRGRVQPLLPRTRPPRRRRPGLLPGPRRAGHLRAGVPGRPAHPRAARELPARAAARRRALVVSPPPAHAGLLAVPDRLHGAGADHGHLPGAVQPLPGGPGPQGEDRPRVGIPRGRRDRRAGIPRRDHPRLAGAAGQPDLRHQLQPPAARRARPRQRQDHPGAGSGIPRRRLERHQGDLGGQLGPAAGPGHAGRAGPAHGGGRRRRLPEVQRGARLVHSRALLRHGSAPPGDGRATIPRRSMPPTSPRWSTAAARP